MNIGNALLFQENPPLSAIPPRLKITATNNKKVWQKKKKKRKKVAI